MDANNAANEIKEAPERFFKLLEAGTLAYSEIIEYAFVIFGITKHGKTTLSHYLVNNSLKAYMNRNQVHYRLDQAKGSHAKIGDKMESQTEIPNRFQTTIKIDNHPLYVIDNPGQLDSFGINRILSNAYFHYRVFSKVKNMKFILVFDSNNFTNNMKETNKIFQLFFKSFINFQQISDQILQSIAIIFTKVDKSSSLADFEQRLQAYENTFNQTRAFSNKEMQFLSKLFKQCKQNKRIKLFRKADLKQEAGKCTFLEQLNEKLSFFTREIDETQNSFSSIFQEKRVKMDNIRFSETKSVQSLTYQEQTRNQMDKLFGELTSRASKMFEGFFNFIEKLAKFLLFEYDKCENVGNSVDKSETLKLSRQNFLRDLTLDLQKYMISYEQQQKYKKSRQLIVDKIKLKLRQSTKVQTFIERLNLSEKLFEFCRNYSDCQKFTKRQKSQILACVQDIEKIFLSISGIYTNSEQIERMAKFFYDIKNYMDQLIIFCMIILPDEKEGLQKIKKFLTDQTLGKFLKCLDEFNKKSSGVQDILTQRMMKEFDLSKEKASEIDAQYLIKLYLVKYPDLLVNNRQYSQVLLKNLITTSLTEDQKIQGVTLMFNTLKDHYNRFMHFKKIVDSKNKNSVIPQQQFQPKNIEKMILSFIALLKQVKKVKDLLNYKSFEKHRVHTYQMSAFCWNSIVKLFVLLIECQTMKSKNEKQQQKQQRSSMPSIDRISPIKSPQIHKQQSKNLDSKNEVSQFAQSIDNLQQIIIELLETHPNIGFIEQIYGKLVKIHRDEFESVTLQSCASKINKIYGKALSGHQSQCMVMFDEDKKASAQKTINVLLKCASNLNEFYRKDKALEKCHQALRYVEYCPQKVTEIQDKIAEIQIHNDVGGWVQGFKEQKKINEFEPSMTAKRLLTKFTLDKTQVKLLDCVKYVIFKSE